jgi:hypothetical protein
MAMESARLVVLGYAWLTATNPEGQQMTRLLQIFKMVLLRQQWGIGSNCLEAPYFQGPSMPSMASTDFSEIIVVM